MLLNICFQLHTLFRNKNMNKLLFHKINLPRQKSVAQNMKDTVRRNQLDKSASPPKNNICVIHCLWKQKRLSANPLLRLWCPFLVIIASRIILFHGPLDEYKLRNTLTSTQNSCHFANIRTNYWQRYPNIQPRSSTGHHPFSMSSGVIA